MNLKSYLLALTGVIFLSSLPAQIGFPPSSGSGKEDAQQEKARSLDESMSKEKEKKEMERRSLNGGKGPSSVPEKVPVKQPLPTPVAETKAPTHLGERPALVIGITVDQMRMDYLYRYWDEFGPGGFKRMIENGMVCADHHFGYAPTYTGPGHASIFTGTTPRYHGVIGNDWYERASGNSVYCVNDPNVTGLGLGNPELRDGKHSPHRMHASTIGDELKLATNLQAKVIGVSLKDRGAILPAGHLADAAYWFYGQDQGKFISSSYYMIKLPKWVDKWNRAGYSEKYLNAGWRSPISLAKLQKLGEDNNPYERPFEGAANAVLPYDLKLLSASNGGYDILKTTPHGNTLVVDFALQAIEEESMGRDEITDLMAISFSATDYVGHQFGAHSWETMDTYVRLDQQLSRLFTALDNMVGQDAWLCWLTADHGAATVPSLAKEAGLPVDYWKPGNMIDDVKADLSRTYGAEEWVLNYSNDQFFLNRPLILEKGLDLGDMQKRIQLLCQTYPGVLMVATAQDLTAGQYGHDEVLSRIYAGWSAHHSGDVIVIPEPGWIQYGYQGTTHGSPFSYDTHVPCLFYGWHVPAGITYERTYIRDIAPTISALIHTPMPNACTGRPIEAVLER